MQFHMKTYLLLALFAACSFGTYGQGSKASETIDWSHTWIINRADTSKMPRVLIIGDSHVERYQPVVAKKLNNIAVVSKITTSKSMGQGGFVKHLASMLDHYEFDFIFFNNGLHGAHLTPAQYAADLPEVFKLLNSHIHAGKLYLINTTARHVKGHLDQFDPYHKDVEERNRLVQVFCHKNNIPVLDFFTLSMNNLSYYTNDGIHFNESGVNAEATMIAETILSDIK